MAVGRLKCCVANGEGALGQVEYGGEGCHGEEDEGCRGEHHVTSVENDGHGEENVGSQPAAESRPAQERGEQSRTLLSVYSRALK